MYTILPETTCRPPAMVLSSGQELSDFHLIFSFQFTPHCFHFNYSTTTIIRIFSMISIHEDQREIWGCMHTLSYQISHGCSSLPPDLHKNMRSVVIYLSTTITQELWTTLPGKPRWIKVGISRSEISNAISRRKYSIQGISPWSRIPSVPFKFIY